MSRKRKKTSGVTYPTKNVLVELDNKGRVVNVVLELDKSRMPDDVLLWAPFGISFTSAPINVEAVSRGLLDD